MNAARALREARRRAGLSQRELAHRSGIPQPAIARIESGVTIPRIDTFARLLATCGRSLRAVPRLGVGVDRTVMRELRSLTPEERLHAAEASAHGLEEFRKEVHFR